ncbi:MAG: hypothetical protein HUJ28_05395 [Chromatiales bacterium]|nr:hypothetical protein [Chromatiales bacterium]
MRQYVKTLGAIVLVVSLLLLAVAQQATQGIRADCRNTELGRVVSPDAAHAAVLFTRDCGDGTEPSTQVSIVRAGREFNHLPGNVLATRQVVDGITLTWRDARRLEIGGLPADAAGEPIRQRAQLEDFTIHYRP